MTEQEHSAKARELEALVIPRVKENTELHGCSFCADFAYLFADDLAGETVEVVALAYHIYLEEALNRKI